MTNIFAWLQEWATVISGLGSVALTFGLVYLYWKQQGLLKRELNREMRASHTETLKKRVRAWHGDIDKIGISDEVPMKESSTNLPTVHSASVDSAPAVVNILGEEDEFRVIPESIEDDQYLHDLLDNHAPELEDLKETIENQNEAFKSAQDSFLDECPQGETIETENYTLQPMRRYPEWVFERAVKLHRAHVDTSKGREKDIAESRLRGTNSEDPEKAAIWYSPISEGGPSTYEAVMMSGDLENHDEFEDEILDQLVELHHKTIDEIGEEGIYEHAVEARVS